MINIDNKKINAIKLGTNNCKRAYVGNDLVFQQGKWVFYKTEIVYKSTVAGYNQTILTVRDAAPNGGKFLFKLHNSRASVMILNDRDNNPICYLDRTDFEDDEAFVLDFKLKDQYHNYLLTSEWGKFDLDKNRFYDGKILEKNRNVSSGWIKAYPLNSLMSADLDIYKWQEE